MAAFDDLGVLPELVNALNNLEWTLPTDIQYEAIPAILGGGDVCMAAETGSGKTGAFCIPILQIVYESMQPKPKGQNNEHNQREKRRPNQPMCLIIEPTKELAQQTHAQIERFGAYLNNPKIKNVIAVGGVNMGEQLASIENGSDILTATPGRIRSLVQEGRVDLGQVRFFVLDEADSLLGGQNDSAKIVHQLHNQIPICGPSGQRLQMIVCSATLHNIAVQKLATQYMHFPQWIDLKGQDSVPETVHQVVCLVDPKEDKSWIRLRSQPGKSVQTDNIHAKDQIRPGTDNAETLSEAVKVLKAEYVLKAIEEHKMDQGIIFCRTKLDCDNLEKFLASRGHTCACLHSDRSPNERTANLQLFKEKKVKFLICTDVAARGLDVKGVPYVINVTLPPSEEKANYVHRIGRVGRAERMGLAISLVSTVPEKVWYHQCRSRGVNCFQTNLVNQGGCAKWYNEISYLGEIEEHLGITINRVAPDMEVPMDEFDGKVVYGTKRTKEAGPKLGHAVEMTGIVGLLSHLEREVQWAYLDMMNGRK